MKRIKSYEQSNICYLVATPIGNLNDFSKRALEILNTVDVIACEDTRNTSLLLSKFGINKPLISYHEHNEQASSSHIISLLKEGKNIAVCSDAGYPGISDPGAIIVKHCIENDIAISIIPGANASLPALIGSGLDTSHYYFYGFLPSKESQRIKELKKMISYPMTLIFYESPHRIKESLNSMYQILGKRKACLCRELTKLHEEYIYGDLEELSNIDETTLKGEMVIIIEGNQNEESSLSDEDIIALVEDLLKEGKSLKEASKEIASKYDLKKNYIYNLCLKRG